MITRSISSQITEILLLEISIEGHSEIPESLLKLYIGMAILQYSFVLLILLLDFLFIIHGHNQIKINL